MARTETRNAPANTPLRTAPPASEQPLARSPRFPLSFGRRSAGVGEGDPQQMRRVPRFNTFWKTMVVISFLMNVVLLIVVGVLVGLVIQYRDEAVATTAGLQSFARNNVAELRDVVSGLESATIRTTIPLDQPLNLQGKGVVVPVDQTTVVTLVEPVPITLANADIDLGNGNRLRANAINLVLPQGTPLNIALKTTIPLDAVTIPVQLSVPVEIPLSQTELGPQFVRLGQLVDRLAGPAGPLLGMDIPPAPPAPEATAVPAPAP